MLLRAVSTRDSKMLIWSGLISSLPSYRNYQVVFRCLSRNVLSISRYQITVHSTKLHIMSSPFMLVGVDIIFLPLSA